MKRAKAKSLPKNRGGFTLIEVIIILAIIAALAVISVPTCSLEGQTRAKVSRVKSDMRSITVALETYRVDHGAYPPTMPLKDMGTAKSGLASARGAGQTTAPWGIASGGGAGLTTPVPYMTSSPIDPFTPGSAYPIAYATDGERFILLSPGPDEVYSISLIRHIDWEKSREAILDSLIAKTYDPTNGSKSYGDVFRFSEPPDAPNDCGESAESETIVESTPDAK